MLHAWRCIWNFISSLHSDGAKGILLDTMERALKITFMSFTVSHMAEMKVKASDKIDLRCNYLRLQNI